MSPNDDSLPLLNTQPDLQNTRSDASFPTLPSVASSAEFALISIDLVKDAPPKTLGRYQLLRELGAGGMGTVYLAMDSVLKRTVALKTPKFPNEDRKKIAIERFYREARAVARLSHPWIAMVFDVGEVDGQHYLSMEFVAGKPLDTLISEKRYTNPAEVIQLVRQIALAMYHAHESGVVHRDLKPGNIMIAADGTPRVMDFGLSRIDDDAETRVTRDGQLIGSPAYMSPEQIEGIAVDNRSDIYSLGVVLYELLAGSRPFQGSLTKVLTCISKSDFIRLPDMRPDVSPRLADICHRMMASDKDQRFQSMQAVAEALEKSEAADSDIQHPVDPVEKPPESPRRSAGKVSGSRSADVSNRPQTAKKRSKGDSDNAIQHHSVAQVPVQGHASGKRPVAAEKANRRDYRNPVKEEKVGKKNHDERNGRHSLSAFLAEFPDDVNSGMPPASKEPAANAPKSSAFRQKRIWILILSGLGGITTVIVTVLFLKGPGPDLEKTGADTEAVIQEHPRIDPGLPKTKAVLAAPSKSVKGESFSLDSIDTPDSAQR
ncbi:MAG: serine/threonine-protein kinase [Planctomycetia bacterium]